MNKYKGSAPKRKNAATSKNIPKGIFHESFTKSKNNAIMKSAIIGIMSIPTVTHGLIETRFDIIVPSPKKPTIAGVMNSETTFNSAILFSFHLDTDSLIINPYISRTFCVFKSFFGTIVY